ncbi:hypothetical protein HDV03_000587 [Kappamyces sp. JEL0829]|nr:hypothetical protein HDV03_000587 [Kappamyces sp. JEL0829]
MAKIEECCSEGYKPSHEDILKLRTVTQSISDTVFKVQSKNIHFIDVSGLKHHRKAWLSYFDDVHSILFVVSLSSYDQVLVEDPSVNRMADALVLFEQITNHPLLKKIDIILFFNKKDLFEVKAKKILVKEFFPEYKGRDGSVSQTAEFFRKKFLSQCAVDRNINTHVTCCTDTKGMEVIIASILNSIVSGLLGNAGLM